MFKFSKFKMSAHFLKLVLGWVLLVLAVSVPFSRTVPLEAAFQGRSNVRVVGIAISAGRLAFV